MVLGVRCTPLIIEKLVFRVKEVCLKEMIKREKGNFLFGFFNRMRLRPCF